MRTHKIKHIKLLINKYYEGLTSKEEEQHITNFLTENPNLQGFDVERAIFGYLHQKKTYSINRYWKYSVAASITLILSTLLILQIPHQNKTYAWINGREINDIEIAKKLAIESLNNVAIDANIMENTLEPFKETNHQVQEQLSVFSDVEF
ncbi:MAG: hypothetical protein CR965_00700 [Paludibacter sp.]|nr:MAG: hypothetical protein CR965_00700 [Paludibacter sp.]